MNFNVSLQTENHVKITRAKPQRHTDESSKLLSLAYFIGPPKTLAT
jgi:hypothetical protein